jgi:cytochrome c1
MRFRWIAGMMLVLTAAGTTGCQNRSDQLPVALSGAHPDQGRLLIQHYGCGACHTIPGVAGADALVGPPLTSMALRTYIAGMLPNTPDNLERWIRDPQQVVPGNAMPTLGVTPDEARDIAAYLYTIR